MSNLNTNDFTHLHLHSTYSIRDGENLLPNIVKKIKELGMSSVALTDHGVMTGVLEFYKACKKENINPVIGMEGYATDDVDNLPKEERNKDNYHLVLLAKNDIGLKNLFKLSSGAALNNFYIKPRISKHNLTPENTEGIIATSACLGSNLNRQGGWDNDNKCYLNRDKMEEIAVWYKQAFKDGYYLEIQDNDDTDQQQLHYNNVLKDISKNSNIPLVITSDAHYTNQTSSELHSFLMAMQFDIPLKDYKEGKTMKYGPWFYIRSPEEMLQAAIKYDAEDAFWNACKIGKECSVNISLGTYETPVFDITGEEDYMEFLRSKDNDD